MHAAGRPGKVEVTPTKPLTTQYQLSLAYSPGVAAPCLEIEKDPALAYDYTAKGNMVAVISTAPPCLVSAISARLPPSRSWKASGALQAFRRCRWHRSRGRYRGCGRVHPVRPLSRQELRRHQSGRHQGAGMLHRGGPAARIAGYPGVPRRPARHRDHLGRGTHQRPASDRAAHPGLPHGGERRGRLRIACVEAVQDARPAGGECRALRYARRHLPGPH